MAEQVNPHYDKLLKQLSENKDSIFEPSRIVAFDAKTLTATTYGIRSKTTKKNVVVLFPSMFLNTGIISIPVKDSVGMSFVGADNETYLFPGQYYPPVKETENAQVSTTSSPSVFDELLNLENLEPGEHVVRSLSGTQVYVSNGEVEMSTAKMHRLSLSELDGTLGLVAEGRHDHIGHSEFYNGTYRPSTKDDSDHHHILESYCEKVPDWETDEVIDPETLRKLTNINTVNESVFPLLPEQPIAHLQKVNVFDLTTDTALRSLLDGEELFELFKLNRHPGDPTYGKMTRSLSKKGAEQIIIERGNERTTYARTAGGNTITSTDGVSTSSATVSPVASTLTAGGNSVVVTKEDVLINYAGGSVSVSDLMNRLERLESLRNE